MGACLPLPVGKHELHLQFQVNFQAESSISSNRRENSRAFEVCDVYHPS